ncbi:PPE domain-containing protein [Nocardia callitridis]|uniref:PPE domain-containing protein n=1 Tax=Nocardia callitridis TaxID=648753 RepID=A0ABP9JTR5_9NOCA
MAWTDWVSSVFGSPGEATKNKQDDQNLSDSEKAKWDTDRGVVNGEWGDLLGKFGDGQFDGPAIKAEDPFETMSHSQIYQALEGVSASDINIAADGWRRLSGDSHNAVDQFGKATEDTITQNWNGRSGAAAIDATRQFTTTFTQLAASFQMVAHGLDLTEGHLGQAKGSVPKPDNYTMGDRVIDSLPFQNVLKGPTHRAQEAESQARFVMTQYYRPGARDVDSKTPILPEPSSRTDNGSNPPPVTPPPGGPGPSGPGTPGTPSGAPNPGTNDSSNPNQPGAATDPNAIDPGAPTDQQDPSTTAASTTPASTTSTPTAQNTPQTPSLTTPGTNPSVPGGIPGLPGGPSNQAPAPGKSLPGSPNAASSAAARTGASMSGKPGMGGSPGMMPHGAGKGKGDDDGEHKTKDYLVYDHGSELLGEQPPALPPGGVIGG